MRVLQINLDYKFGGSTGRIVYELSNALRDEENEQYVTYGRYSGQDDEDCVYRMEGEIYRKTNSVRSLFSGEHGFYAGNATRKLIRKIDEIQPDIIHLHNLHGNYVNIGMLFEYIKKKNISVVWTLHDCWSYTGWCVYYDYQQCDKWIDGCCECKSLFKAPRTFRDRSRENYIKKRATFLGVNRLVIVTPSRWLAGQVSHSFLSEYHTAVINNGIDLNLFKPNPGFFREQNGLKKYLLAVAYKWTEAKGVHYLSRISDCLDGNEWNLVIVGRIGKEKKEFNSRTTVFIDRTEDVRKLCTIYSDAEVLINPTLEDNFPTVNIESLACGTPCVTFDTGGSPEIIDEETGIVVPQKDWESMMHAACGIDKKSMSESCVERAGRYYDKRSFVENYRELYRSMIGA